MEETETGGAGHPFFVFHTIQEQRRGSERGRLRFSGGAGGILAGKLVDDVVNGFNRAGDVHFFTG